MKKVLYSMRWCTNESLELMEKVFEDKRKDGSMDPFSYHPVILKLELLSQGLSVSDEAEEEIGKQLKVDHAVGAVGKHALDIILRPGKVYVGLPLGSAVKENFGADSPFTLEVDGQGNFGSVDGEEDGEDISAGLANIKDAVRILWGEAEEDNLPAAVASAGDMPDSVRVAIASNNGEILNGHFGSCLRFLVYQLNASDCQLIDVRSTVDADLAEDRNDFRAALIGDCQILYVQSIGGPAAAKVVRTGIYPIKQKTSENARDVLGRLQQVMQTSPPPWLAKILGASAEERIRFAQEG